MKCCVRPILITWLLWAVVMVGYQAHLLKRVTPVISDQYSVIGKQIGGWYG